MSSTDHFELDDRLNLISASERPGMYFIPASVVCCLAYLEGSLNLLSEELRKLRDRYTDQQPSLANFRLSAWLLRMTFPDQSARWNFMDRNNQVHDKDAIARISATLSELIRV